jgi:hypothetical protein
MRNECCGGNCYVTLRWNVFARNNALPRGNVARSRSHYSIFPRVHIIPYSRAFTLFHIPARSHKRIFRTREHIPPTHSHCTFPNVPHAFPHVFPGTCAFPPNSREFRLNSPRIEMRVFAQMHAFQHVTRSPRFATFGKTCIPHCIRSPHAYIARCTNGNNVH